jgi:hypothetical protein
MIKVTEEALEQEVASIIANQLNCQWITQGAVDKGQFDVLLLINGFKFVIELEIGKVMSSILCEIQQGHSLEDR